VLDVPPFRVLIMRITDLIWLNYAAPVAPLPEDEEDRSTAFERLRAAFRAHDRVPRFEFAESLWPDLGRGLERAGFEEQARQPLVACPVDGLRSVTAPGVEVRFLDAEHSSVQELGDFVRIQRAVFEGATGFAGDELALHAAQLRDEIRRGPGECVIGLLDGEPVGTGSSTPVAGVTEITGVATLPRARRRGVAATVSYALAAHHFASGGSLVWLSAEDEGAEAVYRKIGFQTVGAWMNYTQRGYPSRDDAS
jgi:ribosomal protein S18 acetylase RimI-like enzyme